MTVYRIKFVGPATLALSVATVLADADGVDLISSEPPSILDEDRVELEVAVAGSLDAVADAVSGIRVGMPKSASIVVAED